MGAFAMINDDNVSWTEYINSTLCSWDHKQNNKNNVITKEIK